MILKFVLIECFIFKRRNPSANRTWHCTWFFETRSITHSNAFPDDEWVFIPGDDDWNTRKPKRTHETTDSIRKHNRDMHYFWTVVINRNWPDPVSHTCYFICLLFLTIWTLVGNCNTPLVRLQFGYLFSAAPTKSARWNSTLRFDSVSTWWWFRLSFYNIFACFFVE